jgi:hypothetical protein
MFLASDRIDQRENKIRSFLSSEPSIALLLAAVNFEWTVSRAVLFLSTTKNTTLRQKLRDYYSLDKYKELWKNEVVAHGHLPLAKLVRNWSSVLKGFDARNVIVHGKDRYTRNMATPHVEALLKGARFVDKYCQDRGKPLYERMPVRKKSAS